MPTKQILSPLPGVFYKKPSADAVDYKQVGDHVEVGEVVGIIEVMKVFHQVAVDTSGKITVFLVENEDAVMAGQPLVEVEV
ncbi:MAG: biotin carboxyl carrier domain-containing protein [Gammaproteobacteria bacterium]|nr:biotin carboxyl carrier domain-containing protein [Gammaproteobacteria bacterium]